MGERVIHTFLSFSLFVSLFLFVSLSFFLSLSLFLRECGGGKSSVRRPSRFTGRSGCGCDLNFYLLPPLLLLSVCQSICLSVSGQFFYFCLDKVRGSFRWVDGWSLAGCTREKKERKEKKRKKRNERSLNQCRNSSGALPHPP